MPLIENLQPFIATLNSVGHEPEILAKSGESIEPIVIPAEGLSDELRGLLQSSSPPSPRGEAAAESSIPSAEEGLDFSSVPAAAEDEAGADLIERGLSGEPEEGSGSDVPGLPDKGEESLPGSGGGDAGDVDLDALLADFPGSGGDTLPQESFEEEALAAP